MEQLTKKNKYLLIVILFFVSFSIMYAFITPPFESPDEFLHLDYINFVSLNKKLPNQYEGIVKPDIFVGQGHQFPLYYILMGILVNLSADNKIIAYEHPAKQDKNWKGGFNNANINENIFKSKNDSLLFYILRIFSIVFSLINLIFVYKLSGLFFQNDKLAIFTVFLTASLPQFQFISGVINNDSFANMISTASIYYLFKMVICPSEKYNFIMAGIILGIGILSKKTLLFIIPCSLLISIYLIHSKKNEYLLKNITLFYILLISISCFIFARNYVEYGELLGNTMEKVTMMQFVEEKSVFSYYFIQPFATGMIASFVGVFGWMNIPLPKIIEFFYIAFMGTGFIYALYITVKEKNIRILFALIFIVLCLGGIIYFNLTFTQYQGRYIFPVLPLIFIVVIYGLKSLMKLFTNNVFSLIGYIGLYIIIFLFDIIGVVILYNHYN